MHPDAESHSVCIACNEIPCEACMGCKCDGHGHDLTCEFYEDETIGDEPW